MLSICGTSKSAVNTRLIHSSLIDLDDVGVRKYRSPMVWVSKECSAIVVKMGLPGHVLCR